MVQVWVWVTQNLPVGDSCSSPPAEECGHTRCVYCFFLSFCPLICELQVQGGQTLLVIHIWDHFKPTERENPLCCILLSDFEQMRRGLSLLSMLAGLNQQEGKPFPLCFIGLLRRGNPFHHPYLFRLVQTNGEGFPSLLGFLGAF